MRIWDKLKHQIKRGSEGLNKGLPMGSFTTLSKYVCGIQQARYDLIFAGTSIGKSAFVNDAYVFGPLMYLQKNPGHIHSLEIIYYSLEITPELQIAKYIARRIWEDHKILTNINEILSRGDNMISQELMDLIDSYEEELDELQGKHLFFRSYLDPDYLFEDIVKYAKSRGTVHYDANDVIIGYTPNNPHLITEIIIDHYGLINKGKYPDLKQAIDQTSRHLVFFRNIFGFSPVGISQINRSSEGMDRRDNGDAWLPTLADIKNSGNPSEDANTVFGIASPFYLQVEKCFGFDITKWKNRYRLIRVVKNRDGDSNLNASFLFIGEIGMFEQLGPASDYDVNPPETLRKVRQFYKDKGNEFN